MKRKPELVFITGAGSGIGRATALRFAAMDATVISTDIDLAAAEETARLIHEASGRAHAYHLDVSDVDAYEKVATVVRDQHGVPDVVINNAGIVVTGMFIDLTDADWQRSLGVHLMGVITGSRLFAAQMVERGKGGHIINVASAAAFVPAPYTSTYCTAKAAIKMLSECMRIELAEHHIGVSAMCFGAINTSLAKHADVRGETRSLAGAQRVMTAGLRYIGANPDVAARAIVGAVRRNKAIVPVRPEAWFLYAAGRVFPGPYRAAAGLGTRVSRSLTRN